MVDTDSNNPKRKTSANVNVMGSMGKMLNIFGYASVLILYNPTGFSYYHWAMKYSWFENMTMSLLLISLGAVIAGMAAFMISGAWKVTEVLGKIIFIAVVAPISGAVVYSSWFNMGDVKHWISLVLAIIMLFVFFGAAYPRLRWKFQRTRQVDDHDSGDDFQ